MAMRVFVSLTPFNLWILSITSLLSSSESLTLVTANTWREPHHASAILTPGTLFFPVRERTFNAGNYFYVCFAKEWKHGTRIGFGGYDFTRNVVATANRAGGQFTLEQRVSSRLTLAAEWYTGNQAAGYVNPGAIVKLTPKLTLYAPYQIGNAGVTTGNHQFLWEIGYNFN